jgi:hypothetical protein
MLTCKLSSTFFVADCGQIENPASRRIGRGTPKPQALPVHPWSEQQGSSRGRSGGAQIFGSRLAGAAVCDDIEADSFSLIEGAHAGAFERADMNKHIGSAIGGLNEAKALLVIKPLHDSRIHRRHPFTDDVHAKTWAPRVGNLRPLIDFGEESERCAPVGDEAKQPRLFGQYRLQAYGDKLARRQGLQASALPMSALRARSKPDHLH